MVSGTIIKQRVGRGAAALVFMLTLFVANLAPLTSLAAADTCTWTGTNSGTWSDGGNWTGCDNANVPESGDTLIFPVGGLNPAMNNDLVALDLADVLFQGNNYALSGNDIALNNLQFSGTGNAVDVNLTFNDATALNYMGSGTNSIGGDIVFSVAGDVLWDAPGNTGTLTLSGAQSGTIGGQEQVINGGTLVVSGAGTQTITGGFVVAGGSVLNCQSSSCLGDSANVAHQQDSAMYLLNSVTLPNTFMLNETSAAEATGLEVADGASATISGAVTVMGDTIQHVGSGSDLTLTGALAVNGGTNLTLEGEGYGSSVWDYNGSGITGMGGIFCDTINCEFTASSGGYGGNIVAIAGSLLEPGASDSLGDTAGNTTINDGASLLLSGGAATYAEPLVIAGSGIDSSFNGVIVSNGSGGQTLSGSILLADSSTIAKQSVPTLTVSNAITGTGNLDFVGNGNGGIVSLTGGSANTYSGNSTVTTAVVNLGKSAGVNALNGNVVVTNGTLVILADEQLPNSSVVTLSNGGGIAGLTLAQDVTETIATLLGDGTVTLTNADSELIFTDADFSGTPTGDGHFTKVGTGTGTVSGTSSHTGGTNVHDGTFIVTGNYASAPLNLQGGVLKGTGTLGTVNANGGTVSPGLSPGILTVATITFTPASNFLVEIDGPTVGTQYDRLVASGAVNLAGASLTVDLDPAYVPAPGTVFTIITAGSVTGTFAGLADDATLRINGLLFRIDYTGTTVTLTFVPEPLVNTGTDAAVPAILSLIILASAGGLMLGGRKKLNSQLALQ